MDSLTHAIECTALTEAMKHTLLNKLGSSVLSTTDVKDLIHMLANADCDVSDVLAYITFAKKAIPLIKTEEDDFETPTKSRGDKGEFNQLIKAYELAGGLTQSRTKGGVMEMTPSLIRE